MPDQLSALYSEFLEGGYDCVDRVVCNAYFSMGQAGGGFRMWWRALFGSYLLSVDETGVLVTAKSAEGIFYGVETLQQRGECK